MSDLPVMPALQDYRAIQQMHTSHQSGKHAIVHRQYLFGIELHTSFESEKQNPHKRWCSVQSRGGQMLMHIFRCAPWIMFIFSVNLNSP